MNINKKIDWEWYLMIILLAALMFIVYIFAGCQVLKSKQTKAVDSTSFHKVDSTAVHKNESHSKEESEWWKETYLFNQPKDTVEKILQPINNYLPGQPTMIIREG